MPHLEPASPPVASDFITLAGTYFHLGTNMPLDFSGAAAFTIEGWLGFTSLESAAPIFSKAGELIFGLTSGGRLFARRRFWDNPLVSADALQPGMWHHVGLTCSGKIWKLFVQGDPNMRFDQDDEAMQTPRPIGSLKVNATLNCEVWNLRIWNRARTAEQMHQAMNSLVVPHRGLIASFFPEPPAASSLRLDSLAEASAA